MAKPKLRFPEFSGKWEVKKFGDLFEFLPTNSFSRAYLNYESGTIKNIHYGDIHTKFPTNLDCEKVDIPYINPDVNLDKIKMESYCKDGDLIIADASEDYDDIGKAIEIKNLGDERLLSGLHTLLARDKSELTVKGYRGYILLNNDLKLQIKKIATGISVLGISKTNLSKLELNIPSIQEQHKIASFLSKVDEKIDLLEKKQELWETYKKGMMQQIFSQKLRFKDENGEDYPDWEEKRLGDLLISSASNLSINNLDDNFGKYPLYGAIGFMKNIDFYEKDHKYIAIVKDGAGVGRTILCPEKSSILGTMQYLNSKSPNDINFLYYLISTINFKKYTIGSSIPHIYYKDYSHERVFTPDLGEQVKIGQFLGHIDLKIEQIKKEIVITNKFKKGLLQQMFC